MNDSLRPIMPGEHIGVYRIAELLGGANSFVYRAFDQQHDRQVALKLLTPQAAEQPDLRARFIQEGKICILLRHPSVIEGYDSGEHKNHPYMVLEFLKGQDLRKSLSAGLITPQKAKLELMAELADALNYVHSKEVIHLDIKPDNLFIRTNGSLKLTDFGIAILHGKSIGRPGTTVGTARYMAPEQILGQAITTQTDLFAFGITLFEILTGSRPFQGRTTKEVFERLLTSTLNTTPLKEQGVPERVIEVIVRCTAKESNQRPATAGEVRDELQKAHSELQPKRESKRPWVPKRETPVAPEVKLPALLVEDLCRGNCVAFVGAGLSMGAGLPGWRTLLKEMLDYTNEEAVKGIENDAILDCIERGDLLLPADELRERLGNDRFHRFIIKKFRRTNIEPTEAHIELIRLPFASLITTNYDKLLETTYTIINRQSLATFTHADFPEMTATLRTGEPCLFKLHGCVDRAQTIILGQRDYHSLEEDKAVRTYFTSIFTTKTVLFIGYSLVDPDLLLLLGKLRTAYKDYSPTCYALVDEGSMSSLRARRLESEYGLKLLRYKASTPKHPELLEFLRALSTAVRSKAVPVLPAKLNAADELAQEVRGWLETIRYEVTGLERIDYRTLKMNAVLAQGTLRQSIHVYCVEGELSVSDVETARAALDLNTPQAWIIADKRISPRVLHGASSDSVVRVFTFSTFLKDLIWGPYINALKEKVTKERLGDLYVDLSCHKLDFSKSGETLHRDEFPSLDKYVDSWLEERGKVHISLLGNFGTGKTWFCHHYAFRMLERYLENPSRERLPLLITLKTFTKSMNAPQLLNDVLLEQYRLPFVGSAFESFLEMSRRGKILLILDGFDEMATQADYNTVVDNFWELARLVTENSKVILTSRTEYFRWVKESERILAGEERAPSSIMLEPARFEVLYINPLDEERIKQLVIKRLGEEYGTALANQLTSNTNLRDMLQKPVLVELLLSVINNVDLDGLSNPAHVYLHATKSIIIRNIAEQRTFTSTNDKLLFLCELAWEMISSGNLRMHYSGIPERIRRYFSSLIDTTHKLDAWDIDLRSQTLLHRDAGGYYEFAHKSLAEYFVALKLGAEIGCLSSPFLTTYRDKNFNPIPPPYEKMPPEKLQYTFGRFSFDDQDFVAVCELLAGMVDENSMDALWDLVRAAREVPLDLLQHTPSNAMRVLVRVLAMRNKTLRGCYLSGVVLMNVTLPMDLRGVQLSGAKLRGVDLKGHDLREADLTDAVFDPGSLCGADLRGAVGLSSSLSMAVSHVLPDSTNIESTKGIESLRRLLQSSEHPVIWATGCSGSGKTTALAALAHLSRVQSQPFYFFSPANITSRNETRNIGSENPTERGLYEGLATFATMIGYTGPQDLLRQPNETAALPDIKQQFWDKIKISLQKVSCLILIDDVDKTGALDLVEYLSQQQLKAKILVSASEQPEGSERTSTVHLEPEPGEFTRLFGQHRPLVDSATAISSLQRSTSTSKEAAPPLPVPAFRPPGPGEYTRTFGPGAAASAVPSTPEQGEFTRYFPESAGPTPPINASSEEGEFTRVFGKSDAPPPMPVQRSSEPGEYTQLFAPIKGPFATPNASTADPLSVPPAFDYANADSPGEATRIFQASSASPLTESSLSDEPNDSVLVFPVPLDKK